MYFIPYVIFLMLLHLSTQRSLIYLNYHVEVHSDGNDNAVTCM